MALGFTAVARRGQHFKLAMLAATKLKSVNLLVAGRTERQFEHGVVAHLQASPLLRKNLITQIGQDEVDKISQASLFGFNHRPDISLGNNGTAIEIKVVGTGQGIRVLVVDATPDRQIGNLCGAKSSRECALLSELADSMNIITVVGPLAQSRNVLFLGRRRRKELSARPGALSTDGRRVAVATAGNTSPSDSRLQHPALRAAAEPPSR